MSKQSKTLERIYRKPPAADIKWDELKALLRSLGYELLKNGGSRRKFYNSTTDALISCHEPHPSPDIGRGTATDIATHLREHGINEGHYD